MLSFKTNNFLRARQQASQVLSKFNTITTKETKGRARESSSSLMETELFSNLLMNQIKTKTYKTRKTELTLIQGKSVSSFQGTRVLLIILICKETN